VSRPEQTRSGPITAAAVLALLTCAIGWLSMFAGGAVRTKPVQPPKWLQRYAVLLPLVHDAPRVGFWGSKRDFFRAQYVLAPLVLEALDELPRNQPTPSLVIVDIADAADRAAALAALRTAAGRRGTSAKVLTPQRNILLVDLRPGAEPS